MTDESAGKSGLLNVVIKETLRIRPTTSTGLERITPGRVRNIAGNFYPENVSYHSGPSSLAYVTFNLRFSSVLQLRQFFTTQ